MSKKFELSVSFGNDLHSVILTLEELEKVQSGDMLTKQFKDTMEGKSYISQYHFKKQHKHSLAMYYDDGEGFVGDLSEAFINER